jgi:adenosylmethionine-8-amino-7-oxononanoate aminotransferase
MRAGEGLPERDARVLWHPYTQHAVDPLPVPVCAADGAVLRLADGSELIDAISSWWCCLHGHGRPEIARAIGEQALALDHVMFAGFTHEPAVRLAEQLLALAPAGLSRVFFSDDGSTAVEVALKMALQTHVMRGEPRRRVFVALEGGYHGDTFGAMSVGDPDPFFAAFAPLLFRVLRVRPDATALANALDELGSEAAGVIIEPLVQGAAGMRMHGEDFVRAVRQQCSARGLPMMADEVMTGFGRTGALFACDRAGVSPDLLCVSKGLTGGTLPLAATLATDAIYDAFLSENRAHTFFHGHTFTGNPIACSAALASLELLGREATPRRLDAIGARIESAVRGGLRPGLADRVADLRRTGGIVALELGIPGGYLAAHGNRWRQIALARGVLLRPLGPVVYAMPPSCTTDAQADAIADAMLAVAEAGAP